MNKDGFMGVNAVAKITGVSKRTLRYYDEIGLLIPSHASDAKYRFYSTEDLARLQQILFYKDIGFNLYEIKKLIETSPYDKREALQRHMEILLLKKRHVDRLIELVETLLDGDQNCRFHAFNTDMIEAVQNRYFLILFVKVFK